MPLPHVRFTVRRLMVATAIIALFAAAVAEYERRQTRFAVLAKHYERLEGKYYRTGSHGSQFETQFDRFLFRRFRYYDRLRAKYSRAARRHWLHVSPDPPEPE